MLRGGKDYLLQYIYNTANRLRYRGSDSSRYPQISERTTVFIPQGYPLSEKKESIKREKKPLVLGGIIFKDIYYLYKNRKSHARL